MRLVESLFTHLIGLAPEHCTRKSAPAVVDRPVGILGVPVAFAGVTEVQGRQSAHGHFLVWTDISPVVIQRFLAEPVIRSAICQRIDSVVCASIPASAREASAQLSTNPCAEPTPAYRDGRIQSPLPTDRPAFDSRVHAVTYATGRHASHTASCRKGVTVCICMIIVNFVC
jgi:hypothetical protein